MVTPAAQSRLDEKRAEFVAIQITDDDMVHAYRHPIRVFDLDDLTMLVGADTAGRMLEVGSPNPRASSSSSTPCPPEPSSWSNNCER